jgi:dTMP kinase
MTSSGIFITFEGIDGAGKSTHIAGLADAFKAQGRAVTLTREPGGTPLAEKLRTLVLNDPMDAMTEALLVFAARRDHLQQVIEPALARNEVVLCDRFTDATFAYQGGGRGFDFEILTYLEQLIQTVQGIDGYFVRHPDLTLWFDLAPEVAAVRLAGARVPDKFEAQPVTFFTKVRAAYQTRCDAHATRFARIDADRSRDAVWQDVYAAARCRGWLT